jgi:periplasmic divalent cation tolerance protein
MYQLVFTTCPNEEVAKIIATCLVSERLAACVNIVPNITSIYSWEDKIQCDTEVQLLIKTTKSKFAKVKTKVNELHPYDVVEIIALNIQQGDTDYLNWISNSLK